MRIDWAYTVYVVSCFGSRAGASLLSMLTHCQNDSKWNVRVSIVNVDVNCSEKWSCAWIKTISINQEMHTVIIETIIAHSRLFVVRSLWDCRFVCKI